MIESLMGHPQHVPWWVYVLLTPVVVIIFANIKTRD